ncbi:hypothetical protein [Oenococcus oeni]|uniref:hypothetical protein n=1 Tax=Oenococcus oeni TaxID=1247 RepID=UPI000BDE6570|nr:hypothetical protein [Oenococcus oeni]PDH89855.1 hypothetical protein AO465_01980 [Oenococcus oeni]
MKKINFCLFLLTGTFGISTGTAAAIYTALIRCGTNLSVGRLIALAGITGGTTLIVSAIVGLGGGYILQKLRAGKRACTAW